MIRRHGQNVCSATRLKSTNVFLLMIDGHRLLASIPMSLQVMSRNASDVACTTAVPADADFTTRTGQQLAMTARTIQAGALLPGQVACLALLRPGLGRRGRHRGPSRPDGLWRVAAGPLGAGLHAAASEAKEERRLGSGRHRLPLSWPWPLRTSGALAILVGAIMVTTVVVIATLLAYRAPAAGLHSMGTDARQNARRAGSADCSACRYHHHQPAPPTPPRSASSNSQHISSGSGRR